MGKKVHRKHGQGAIEIETQFISAFELYNQIKDLLFDNDLHVDLNDFRSSEKHTEKFWNLIYYFNEYHLPFEFILPY